MSSKTIIKHGSKKLNAIRTVIPLSCAFLVSVSLHAGTPANAIVEMIFSEGTGGGAGLTTANDGTLAGTATFADSTGTNVYPAFSTNVPAGVYVPAVNGYSVDFDTFIAGAEGRAVDLATTASPPGDGTLGSMSKVTVCAWVNARTFGNRGQIAYALQGPGSSGFSFAQNSVGKLGLGINQDAANAPSSAFALTASGSAAQNNWAFVAATYDPTLESGQLKYYYGRPDKLAVLGSVHNYLGGDVVSSNVDFTGPLSIGNANAFDSGARDTTSNAGNALFRGLIDEIKIYTNALTLEEIQEAQINSSVAPVAASIIRQPANKIVPEGQDALFDVDATGSGWVTYQWKTNSVDVPGATNSTFTLPNVISGNSGMLVSVGVSNLVGGVLSANATLTVVLADPHLAYLSYVEGTPKTTDSTISSGNQNIDTANVGILKGGGHFVQKTPGANTIGAGTYPVFSTNVPVGPYAPSPDYNRYSLNMGDVKYASFPDGLVASQGGRAVDFTNSLGSPANSLGSMSGLTICCWVNAGSLTFRGNNGGMGSQIVFAETGTDRSGFALSHKADWSIQLNINEWPGGSLYRSFGYIPVVTGDDGNAIFPQNNWYFIAVTYDGTKSSQNLNYYFGTPETEVALDAGSPQDANRGVITNTGPLTVGNLNSVTTLSGRTINGDNAAFFRGLIDELHIFNRVLTFEEIKQMQKAPALPAYLAMSPASDHIDLSWEQGEQPLLPAIQLESTTNLGAGSWTNVSNATNVSGSVRSLTLPVSGGGSYFRLKAQ